VRARSCRCAVASRLPDVHGEQLLDAFSCFPAVEHRGRTNAALVLAARHRSADDPAPPGLSDNCIKVFMLAQLPPQVDLGFRQAVWITGCGDVNAVKPSREAQRLDRFEPDLDPGLAVDVNGPQQKSAMTHA